NLKQRVGELEASVGRLQSGAAGATTLAHPARVAAPAADTVAAAAGHPAPETAADREPTLAELLAVQAATPAPRTAAAPLPGGEVPPPLPEQPSAPPHRETVASSRVEAASATASAAPPRSARTRGQAAATPSSIDAAARVVRRWFTTGNVPVKVGMLVLLAGVAALL